MENLKDPVLNVASFEESCGVGIKITDDDIESAVKVAMDHYKSEVLEKRYRFNLGTVLSHVRNLPGMSWADGGKVRNEAETQLIVLLGPKTDADRLPLPKEAGQPKAKDSNTSKSNKGGGAPKGGSGDTKAAIGSAASAVDEDENLTPQERIINILKKLPFHKPGGNYTTEGYPTSGLAMELLKKHMKETGGQVLTIIQLICP